MWFSTSACNILRAELLCTTPYVDFQRAVLHNPPEALPLLGVRVQPYGKSMTDSRTNSYDAVRQT